ncbi:hypothetical protein KHU50_001486 [Colletotrichum sp. SAR 10_65]|nr:hypothetical protein K4K51_012013 [Colletotrichum sp. SAR 10_75]KAI8205603.1 hypothetical protein KHU50_001486 [Colletotrichum sp. SAR 10_65]
MEHSGNLEGNSAPKQQQQLIVPILQNFEQIIDSAIAGRTSAQLSSDVRNALARVDPHTKEILTAILYFVVSKINASVAQMDANARDADEQMNELSSQMLNANNYAVAQAIDTSDAREGWVQAKEMLMALISDVDNRVRKSEEQGSTALKVANLARDSFKYWDKGVQEELEEMFNKRMPIVEAHIRAQYANQTAGATTADANMRELAERLQALENSLRQDLANQAQNVEGYVQREQAQLKQLVEEKVAEQMKEKTEAQDKKIEAQEKKIGDQDKKIKALEAKIEALMNMRG